MRNIAVLTSGGDSPGMNAAIRAVTRYGIAEGLRVFAVRRGYEGLLAGRIEELHPRDVSGLMHLGGSVIQSARCMEMYEDHGPKDAADILLRNEIEGLVVIGGDGSYRGALKIAEHGVPVVGLPGTIDNDIVGSERTIGFDTAVNTLAWCLGRLRDTAASHHRTFVVEAMGRNAGWLALYSGLAGGADVILVPEIQWTREEALAVIRRRVEEGRTFHLVVISEGAGDANELAAWLQGETPDELEVRATIPGHIQRGGEPSVADRVFATLCGKQAVDALKAGRHGIMVGEQRGEIVEVPLEQASEGSRRIDREMYDLAMEIG
jgi:6-phosphofructokinase 1